MVSVGDSAERERLLVACKYSGTRAVVVVAFVLTFFPIFNIPVFWPILVLYFIILFSLTMKRQIMHMIRYRYLPFSYGKRQYKGKEVAAS
jgi:hypothetical protein